MGHGQERWKNTAAGLRVREQLLLCLQPQLEGEERDGEMGGE